MMYSIEAVEKFEYPDGRVVRNRFILGRVVKRKGETICDMIKRCTHVAVPDGCRYISMWGRGVWEIGYIAERMLEEQVSMFELVGGGTPHPSAAADTFPSRGRHELLNGGDGFEAD